MDVKENDVDKGVSENRIEDSDGGETRPIGNGTLDNGAIDKEEVIHGNVAPWLIALTFWSGLGAFSFGFCSSTVGFVIADPNFIALTNWPAHLGLEGAIISLFHVGGFVGTLAVTVVADRFGRKAAFLWCAVWTVIGTAIQAGSTSLGMIIAGRALTGIGAWPFVFASEIYQQELAPASRRGMLGLMTGVLLGTGYSVASWSGVGFSFFSKNSMSWRALLLLQLIGPLFILAGLPFVPESPRWLISKGRNEQALTVLLKVHKNKKDTSSLLARAEHYQIIQQCALERTLNSSWKSLFTTYRRQTAVSALVAAGYMGNGAFFLAAYGPQLYASLGYSYKQSIQFQAGWLTVILTSCFFVPLMDRFGRKFFLLFGLAGCTVCLAIEAGLVAGFTAGGPEVHKSGKAAAVAVLYIYIFFDAFIEPTVWLYTCECFPLHIRAKGFALSLVVITIMNTWINESSGTALANIGYKAYFVYIFMSFVGCVLFYFFVPETMNVPLEEIAGVFGKENEIAVRQEDALRDEQRMGATEKLQAA